MYRELGLRTSKNGIYDALAVLEVVIYAAITEKSIEECASKLRDLTNDLTPSPDTVIRRLGEFSKDRVFEVFDAFVAHMVAKARRKGLFKKPVLVAIDLHDEPYYGKDRPPEVKGTKNCKGTNYAYQYIVLDIVVEGQRFTIAILPVPALVNVNKLVKSLLGKVIPLIEIEAVLLDRGFYSVDVPLTIIEMGLVFEMPAPRNTKVNEYIHQNMAFRFSIDQYTITGDSKKVTVTIVMAPTPRKKRELPDRDNHFLFFTNGPVDEKSIPEKIGMYDDRWGIETGFRVRDNFHIGTTTRNPVIRYFFFVLAAMLYDHWLLVNVMSGWVPNPHYDYEVLAREFRWWVECYIVVRLRPAR